MGPLEYVLEATGYLYAGSPSPGVRLGIDAQRIRRGRCFSPDASWQGSTATTVYFKYCDSRPNDATISAWRREIWNEGFAPLLWVISPPRIDLFNGYGRPVAAEDADEHLLRSFEAVDQQLIELDELAGRLAMETGQFWSRSTPVSRDTSVDAQLLSDLAALERDLLKGGLSRELAQALIGRSMFAQYLVDREIVDSNRLEIECGVPNLPQALRTESASERLFDWLARVFGGDIFTASAISGPIDSDHLGRIADFLDAVDPETGQTSFFPYQFDIIPIEIISLIYEQFAHSANDSTSKSAAELAKEVERSSRSVHYTRLPVVSLILDEVMSSAHGNETVLDLTCGSGIFLVEAFRRLVERKTTTRASRELIRSTLYKQVFGVDISEAAVRVAAFSLYLAALELDPDPRPPEALRFERLIGRTLLIGDARDIETKPEGSSLLSQDGKTRTFDVIVGNPPWTFRGREGTADRRRRLPAEQYRQPRGEALDFLLRTTDFGDSSTKYGIVLSAMPFFSSSRSSSETVQYVTEKLPPVTLVNVTQMTKWLFPTAKMPAILLLAGHRSQDPNHLTLVNVPWSLSAEKSHTFEISPGDVKVLSRKEWSTDPSLLKVAANGKGRDMLLVSRLRNRFMLLSDWLSEMGSEWRDGLILGKPEKRTNDTRFLQDLDFLQASDLSTFHLPEDLPRFTEDKAQWPRSREIYKAPLLLIKEFMKGGARPITAVSERDLVFTDAFFGVSLPQEQLDSARLICGVLGSALAGWFFLMTASEFGVWKRRLFVKDTGMLPIPNPSKAFETEAGKEINSLQKRFSKAGPTEGELRRLDNAVFSLYGLNEFEKVVVRDGFSRAGWNWVRNRDSSIKPASIEDVNAYAETFVAGLDIWLQATNRRHVDADILDFSLLSPIRVVRFVIQRGRRTPTFSRVTPEGNLAFVLSQIEQRLRVKLNSALIGERELRVHGENEVIIIKPAARKNWMKAAALEDVDAVVSESFSMVKP